MEQRTGNFQAADFILFSGFFGLSLSVGLFYAYRDRKKTSTSDYYYGGKDMSPIPVAMSFAVSFVSAITVIGMPAEVYFYGIVYGWQSLNAVIVILVVCKYYIPLFHKLQVTSVCQYLELRFDRNVRSAVSGVRVFCTLTYLAIATFVPALALSTVTPLGLTWTIAITTITCTIYTTLGGFVAVIWTDVLQAGVMAVGMIALFVSTVITVGGFEAVLEASYRGGRINVLTLGLDPRIRSSFTALVIGESAATCCSVACAQAFIQRWLACKTVRRARMATIIALFPMLLFFIISYLNGLAAYAYYEGCDPLASGQISKPDQLIPYMSVDVLSSVPGVAGLFVSAAFCGTLSSVSSGINALSVQVLEDFIVIKYPNLSQKRRILIGQAIAAISGGLLLLTTCVVAVSPDNVTQLLTFYSVFSGPVLAIYTMGVFMPWIDCKGALIGSAVGLATVIWISASATFSTVDKSRWQRLPQLTNECPLPTEINSINVTDVTSAIYANSTYSSSEQEIGVLGSTILAISPFFYSLFGTLMSIIAGHIASVFTGFRKPPTKGKELSISLVNEKFLPKRLRKYYIDDDESDYQKGKRVPESDE